MKLCQKCIGTIKETLRKSKVLEGQFTAEMARYEMTFDTFAENFIRQALIENGGGVSESECEFWVHRAARVLASDMLMEGGGNWDSNEAIDKMVYESATERIPVT